MSPSAVRTCVAVVVAACLVAAALLWQQGNQQDSADEADVIRSGYPPGAKVIPDPVVRRRSVPDWLPKDAACLLVRNIAGQPVQGAQASVYPRPFSVVTLEELHKKPGAPKSGSDGVLVLDGPTIRKLADPNSFLVVLKERYHPATLGHIDPGNTVEVTLRLARDLIVHTVDTQNRSLPGITVRLSAAAGPSLRRNGRSKRNHILLRPRRLGGPSFLGVSDRRGIVRFFGLAPRWYAVEVGADEQLYVPQDRARLADGVDVSETQRFRIVLVEPWACVAQVVGDEALSWKFSPEDPSLWDVGERYWRQRIVTRVLEEKYSGCAVFVQVPRRNPVSTAERRAVLDLGLRHGGWQRYLLVMRPVSKLAEPRQLASEQRDGLRSGRLLLALHDPRGRRIEARGTFRVVPRDGQWKGRRPSIAVVPDKSVEVPAGVYRVVYGDYGFPTGVLPEKAIRVGAGSTVAETLFLKESVYPYVWEVRLPDGSRPEQYVLQFWSRSSGSLTLTHREGAWDGKRRFWFREGTVDYRVYVFGYPPKEGSLLVRDRNPVDQVVKITVGANE